MFSPYLPESTPHRADLAEHVLHKAVSLGAMLHPITRRRISALVRNIQSYYSNAIEGHSTYPIDVENAMRNVWSTDPANRDVNRLIKAHVDADLRLRDSVATVTNPDFIAELHRLLYDGVPDSFLELPLPDGSGHLRLIPGEFRNRAVKVGYHIAPSPDRISDLLTRFNDVYDVRKYRGHERVFAWAASHHRLLWIHPFTDGNGRVARLFSHQFARRMGVDADGCWSISRGLGRHRDAYMSHLAEADGAPRFPTDGRGPLSLDALNAFCDFWMETALDQIEFMGSLFELDSLIDRIHKSVAVLSSLRPEAAYVLEMVALRGEIARGEISRITGLKERTARTLTHDLLSLGYLESASHKAPVRLGIPPEIVGVWFPSLYPNYPLP